MLKWEQCCPGVQSSHCKIEVRASRGLYVPGGQADGVCEPRGQYDPMGQVLLEI